MANRKRKLLAAAGIRAQPREPSGRLQRPAKRETEAEATATATEARMRVHGLAKPFAATSDAGWALGRLLQGHGIHPKQARELIETGERWLEVRRAYERGIAAPGPPRSGTDFTGPRGRSDILPDPARTSGDIAAYHDARRAILNADPMALLAVEAIVLEEKESSKLLGPAMLGLNALAKLWRIGRWA